MSDAEREFWASFEYDNEADRWLVAPGLDPIGVLMICVKKMDADREALQRALRGAVRRMEEG